MEKENLNELIKKSGLRVCETIALEGLGLFTAPASKGHHLAYRGGLIMHSANVANMLALQTRMLEIKWSRPESPYIVGLLHDLVKCRCYVEKEDGGYEYRQPAYPGHGVCSVAIAAELGIRLREDEIAAITYHMGLYGAGKEYTAEEFNNALKLYAPQIIATCCADWYSARVTEEGSCE